MVAYLLKMCLQRLLRTLVYLWGGEEEQYIICVIYADSMHK